MLLALLENCNCVLSYGVYMSFEQQGMELPHVHLVFNLVMLVKQVNETMECMHEITSLSVKKKKHFICQFSLQ